MWNITTKQRRNTAEIAGTASTQKTIISFFLKSLAMKFCRDVCKYINDVIVKGFIIELVGSLENMKTG